MNKYRMVVKTIDNEVYYTKFAEVDKYQLEEMKSFAQQFPSASFLHLDLEDGTFIAFNPQHIVVIMVEKSSNQLSAQ